MGFLNIDRVEKVEETLFRDGLLNHSGLPSLFVFLFFFDGLFSQIFSFPIDFGSFGTVSIVLFFHMEHFSERSIAEILIFGKSEHERLLFTIFGESNFLEEIDDGFIFFVHFFLEDLAVGKYFHPIILDFLCLDLRDQRFL